MNGLPSSPRTEPWVSASGCRLSHWLAFAIGVSMLALPSAAWAYVDPGSGILLWQGLIALVGVVVAFVAHPIRAIKRLFKRSKRQ